ncbi:S-adenosyl-L-methionine-dependent methyltransferase, partial [Mycena vulgaris]
SVENCFRSSAYLADTIMAPKAGIVPYNRAFNTDQPMYYWLQRSENAYKLKRFGLGMKGTASSEPADTIFQGARSILVDVGGGIGAWSLSIAKRYPQLHVVIQDLAHTVEEVSAVRHWNADFKEHIERKMVEFQGPDFFNPQPVQNVTVFFLRYIIHNWDDARAVEILKRLRAAVLPTTQLAVVENILAGACHDQGSDVNKIPGAFRPCARAPLLANWGVATSRLYFYDIGVHTMLGGGGRTLDGFVDVLKQAGWDLVQVHHCPRSQHSHLVA